ncbi:MAG: nucleotide-diphospho-sugar transferase [Patescibacteria group bacterium]|nr:nucleotide-diphospho-sugar transferase [Patescibacteria group bacterium]
MNQFNTPILFLIFNRLETTKQVFAAIRERRPKYLFVAADGPRDGKIGEAEICEEVRQFVKGSIDWDCEVKTLFRGENLGCKLAVSGAINWFFSQVKEGIILEDDCLPDQSFFPFCENLLEKYRNSNEVAIISGNNFNNKEISEASYYFNKIPHIWGWATWRRTWEKYDVKMSEYQNFKKEEKIKNIWSDKRVQNYWINIFNEVYNNKIDTWDYQLTFSIFLNNNLCICPNVNLVSNIGFGKDSTNTLVSNKSITNLPVNNIIFPLIHPKKIEYNEKNDDIINNFQLKNYRLKKVLKYLGIFSLVKKVYTHVLSYSRQ